MRDAVGRLMRTDTHLSTDALTPYYQDVYDHVLRTAETVDNARDLVASILDANLTEQSNELNEITKKLASRAVITGCYGQNVPYPGFGQHSGFIISTRAIVVLAGGLYALLRRRRWL